MHVDAVGGASAGSIVAMMFAFCLVEGLDPTEVLRRAWIDEVDVDTLRAARSDSPLGFEQFRREFDDGDIEAICERLEQHELSSEGEVTDHPR